ncbi:twin-arginine translocation signal domain-containing protein [bacterium]|nr:twin-arginine translocation signal domain-containing protein [bacterium]
MPDREPWDPCPAGELSGLQESLQARSRRLRSRRRFLLGGSVAVTLAGLGTYLLSSGSQANAAPISCIRAKQLIPSYIDGTLKDRQNLLSLKAHLAHCPVCRVYYEKLL